MTDTPELPPGTLVIVNGRLGRVVKPARLGAAAGYSVTTAVEGHEGTAPHFVEAYAVRVARVGGNVCPTPRGGCWCGLVHVAARDLEAVRRAEPVEAVTTTRGLL